MGNVRRGFLRERERRKSTSPLTGEVMTGKGEGTEETEVGTTETINEGTATGTEAIEGQRTRTGTEEGQRIAAAEREILRTRTGTEGKSKKLRGSRRARRRREGTGVPKGDLPPRCVSSGIMLPFLTPPPAPGMQGQGSRRCCRHLRSWAGPSGHRDRRIRS